MNKNKSAFVSIETVQEQVTEIIKWHLESKGIPVFLECENGGEAMD